MKFSIKNIVSQGNLGVELSLERICLKCASAEYEPNQFPGLIYRMENPKATFLLFRSGKVVCVGVRSVRQVKEAWAKLEKEMRRFKL